jgi:hypothetical protein
METLGNPRVQRLRIRPQMELFDEKKRRSKISSQGPIPDDLGDKKQNLAESYFSDFLLRKYERGRYRWLQYEVLYSTL